MGFGIKTKIMRVIGSLKVDSVGSFKEDSVGSLNEDSDQIKKAEELGWWVNSYVSTGQTRKWATENVFELSGPVMGMSNISEWYGWLKGKAMLDMCSGPIPWEDDVQPAILVCQDWLVHEYEKNMLIHQKPARLYVNAASEALPFCNGTFDYIHFENALDHVNSPEQSISSAWRVLKPGGYCFIGVDLGGRPTPAEPHVFTLAGLNHLFCDFQMLAEQIGLKGKAAYNPEDKSSCVRRLYQKPTG